MEKVLPMAIPPSETYQLTSFMMGIISQNKNVRNSLFNTYINLYVSKNEWGEMSLDFFDAQCEHYRVNGIGEMDLFYLKNISKSKCKDFLKERIDQDNYLLLFEIDEYELSYSKFYQKVHFMHDAYVYGYDDDCFWVMAYSKEHLCMMRIPQQEIVDGLYSMHDKESHLCSFRIYHKVKVKLSIKEILLQVNNYLAGGENDKGETVGISVYDCLQDMLTRFKKNRDDEKFLDPKPFRAFWEHKKMLLLRNHHLVKKIEKLDALTPLAEKMEQQGSMIMMLTLKFNMKQDFDIIDRIRVYLDEMMGEEKAYWSSFREILSDRS